WPDHMHPYALRHYPEHLLDAKRYGELYALARNGRFLQAQAAALPSEPHAPLHTLQTTLEGAVIQDDAGRMAEFSLAHARRLQELTQESPLDAARGGHAQRAWGLADLFDVER